MPRLLALPRPSGLSGGLLWRPHVQYIYGQMGNGGEQVLRPGAFPGMLHTGLHERTPFAISERPRKKYFSCSYAGYLTRLDPGEHTSAASVRSDAQINSAASQHLGSTRSNPLQEQQACCRSRSGFNGMLRQIKLQGSFPRKNTCPRRWYFCL